MASLTFSNLRICLLGALALASCATQGSKEQLEWPPADFRLAVEEYRPFEGDRVAPARSFVVLADGTALYREASQLRFDPVGTLALPVFTSACCYRLVPDSVRLLSRKLHKAGALDLATAVEPRSGDRVLAFGLRSGGRQVQVTAFGQVRGALARQVRIANSYMPERCEFVPAGMGGEAEENRLKGVPAPVESLEGSLAFHLELLERFPKDAMLVLDAFVLACAKGDRDLAGRLLRRWRELEVDAPAPGPFDDDNRPPTAEQLIRLVPA